MTKAVTIVQARVGFVDPHDCTDSADTLALLDAVFDGLVRRDAEGRYQPALAARWTVSEDARRWTFHLRSGLTFHDGSRLDAKAMVFSLERMKREDIGATLGAPAVWRQYLGAAKIVDEDDLTLAIDLDEPLADLLDILVSGYALPPHLADTPDFLNSPVGSGAYRVESIGPGGDVVLCANPGWWGAAPANQTVIVRPIPSSRERAEMLHAGIAQVASRLMPADTAAFDRGEPVTCVDHIDPTAIIYLLNAGEGPCADPRVRRALNLATDRRALIDTVLNGAGQPLTGFISPSHFGAGRLSDDHPGADIAESRRLLAEAGYDGGLTLAVACPTRLPDEAEALTHALAGQLARVGVRLEVHLVKDRTRYAEQVRDKRIHDMCLFDSSPMSTFRVLYEKIDSRVEGSWWQGYANDKVEALLDTARRTVFTEAREQVYRQAYDLLRQDPAWLTLYNHVRRVALAGRHRAWRMRSDGVLDIAALPRLEGPA